MSPWPAGTGSVTATPGKERNQCFVDNRFRPCISFKSYDDFLIKNNWPQLLSWSPIPISRPPKNPPSVFSQSGSGQKDPDQKHWLEHIKFVWSKNIFLHGSSLGSGCLTMQLKIQWPRPVWQSRWRWNYFVEPGAVISNAPAPRLRSRNKCLFVCFITISTTFINYS